MARYGIPVVRKQMKTFSLQSGSNGNAIYVESGSTALLFDAGISGRQAALRLEQYGRDIRQVHAVVISHDHSDHIRCAGVYQRKFGLPIVVTRKTLAATTCRLGSLSDVRFFEAGQELEFENLRVQTIPTPHDASDGVAFVVEAEGRRLGIFTDLGHTFAELQEWLSCVDAAYLESNFDPHMLAEGPYPDWLQERIRGPQGHLSNEESARLVAGLHRPHLQWLALAHLSQDNNTPDCALATHRKMHGTTIPLHIAGRHGSSELLQL